MRKRTQSSTSQNHANHCPNPSNMTKNNSHNTNSSVTIRKRDRGQKNITPINVLESESNTPADFLKNAHFRNRQKHLPRGWPWVEDEDTALWFVYDTHNLSSFGILWLGLLYLCYIFFCLSRFWYSSRKNIVLVSKKDVFDITTVWYLGVRSCFNIVTRQHFCPLLTTFVRVI